MKVKSSQINSYLRVGEKRLAVARISKLMRRMWVRKDLERREWVMGIDTDMGGFLLEERWSDGWVNDTWNYGQGEVRGQSLGIREEGLGIGSDWR